MSGKRVSPKSKKEKKPYDRPVASKASDSCLFRKKDFDFLIMKIEFDIGVIRNLASVGECECDTLKMCKLWDRVKTTWKNDKLSPYLVKGLMTVLYTAEKTIAQLERSKRIVKLSNQFNTVHVARTKRTEELEKSIADKISQIEEALKQQ